MSEEQVKNNEIKLNTADDLITILGGEFASSAIKVYINSLDQEVTFKEITVQQQKTLTRIMSANERRKDIVYDAQCALINKVCVTEGFDIYKLSEFDRMKLMIILYQSNMMQNEVKFTCEECGTENVYVLDFDNVIKRLDQFTLEPKVFSFENKKYNYECTLAYPQVKRVSAFHESYCRIHSNNSPKRLQTVDDGMQNMEYINIFIKSVKITNKETQKQTDIIFDDYPVDKIEKILAIFPQDILYSNNGVLKFIVNEMIKPINDAFDKHECFNCHTLHEKENANQAERFF